MKATMRNVITLKYPSSHRDKPRFGILLNIVEIYEVQVYHNPPQEYHRHSQLIVKLFGPINVSS